jgi:hypothetical protein
MGGALAQPIGESSPVNVNCSLMNSTRTPRAVRVRTRARRSSRSSQAVHRVHDDRVTVADEPEHRLQLRPGDVFAGGTVGERAIQLDGVQLTVGVLVNTADAQVTNPLSAHPAPKVSGWTLRPGCQVTRCPDESNRTLDGRWGWPDG